jgi:hypothetical protein
VFVAEGVEACIADKVLGAGAHAACAVAHACICAARHTVYAGLR